MSNVFYPATEPLRYTRKGINKSCTSTVAEPNNRSVNRSVNQSTGVRLLNALNLPEASNRESWNTKYAVNRPINPSVNRSTNQPSNLVSNVVLDLSHNQQLDQIGQRSSRSNTRSSQSTSRPSSQSTNQSSPNQSIDKQANQPNKASTKPSTKQSTRQSTNDTNDGKSITNWLYGGDGSVSEIVVLDDDHEHSITQPANRSNGASKQGSTGHPSSSQSSAQTPVQTDDDEVVLQPVTRTNKRKMHDEVISQSTNQSVSLSTSQLNGHSIGRQTNQADRSSSLSISQSTTQPSSSIDRSINQSRSTNPSIVRATNYSAKQPAEPSLDVQSFDPFDIDTLIQSTNQSTSQSSKRPKHDVNSAAQSNSSANNQSVNQYDGGEVDLQRAIAMSLAESSPEQSSKHSAKRAINPSVYDADSDEDQPLSLKLLSQSTNQSANQSTHKSTHDSPDQSTSRSDNRSADPLNESVPESPNKPSSSSWLGTIVRRFSSALFPSKPDRSASEYQSTNRHTTRSPQSDFAREAYEDASMQQAIERSLSPHFQPLKQTSCRSNNQLANPSTTRPTRQVKRVRLDQDFQSSLNDTSPYLTYPPPTHQSAKQSANRSKKGGVTLTRGDIYRLNEEEFFNDSLIEFFMIYLKDLTTSQSADQSSDGSNNRSANQPKNRAINQPIYPFLTEVQKNWYAQSISQSINNESIGQCLSHRMYMFNSFFYSTFTSINQALAESTDPKYIEIAYDETYEHVKNWTVRRSIDPSTNQSVRKPINLFDLDWLIIPVNDSARHHWALIIVCFPYKEMINQPDDESTNQPVNQSINQSTNQSRVSNRFLQSSTPALNDPFRHFTNRTTRPGNQSINQSGDRLIDQSINQPTEPYNPKTDHVRSLPCILVLDSLTDDQSTNRSGRSVNRSIGDSSAVKLARPIYEYLEREWKTQHKLHMKSINQSISETINRSTNQSDRWADDDQSINQSINQCRVVPLTQPTRIFDEFSMPIRSVHLPQQSNDHDCGPFLVEYMKTFFLCPFVDTSSVNQSIDRSERAVRLNNRLSSTNHSLTHSLTQPLNQSIDLSIGQFEKLCSYPCRETMRQMIVDQHDLQQAIKQSTSQSINQSTDQFFIPESPNVKQSINQSNNQSNSQSINQSNSRSSHSNNYSNSCSTNRLNGHSTYQSNIQSNNQSISRSINQSINQSTNRPNIPLLDRSDSVIEIPVDDYVPDSLQEEYW